MSSLDFTGKQVLITGASRGLGFTCARQFAEQGAAVLLLARGATELDAAVQTIRSAGGHAEGLVCDVTDDAQVQAIVGALPRIDVLINNAGTNKPQPFLEVDVATLDMLLQLNVRSMFVMAQAVARRMRDQGCGVIINMSSQMGHVGSARRTVYCMSKHAIEGLTKAMAVELAPHGIRVNSIAPTYIDTPMTKPFFEDEAFRRDVLSRIPLGRVGEMREVADAVLFLASDMASLVNGASLLVDGGYTAQ